ncbi:hypothetical protein [Candidatus Venteria ishoeyi]|uniref:Transposase IS200 like protein n=1 Tax=Candidatus Venteria ishoeyi TaxID=1899563 RepID=A0A1H6F3D1_9GAMM|nr:hypothetical protein [Candidatus Venteria ishoeyi]SEH04678.1 Uncharacterised protein [Candidatus Venteria ishoeyi]
MSNHYHLVLHVDYEHSLNWNAEEVVKRWEYFKWLSSFLQSSFLQITKKYATNAIAV